MIIGYQFLRLYRRVQNHGTLSEIEESGKDFGAGARPGQARNVDASCRYRLCDFAERAGG
jgi:hypothetical protein